MILHFDTIADLQKILVLALPELHSDSVKYIKLPNQSG
jgi:hypothetical protein